MTRLDRRGFLRRGLIAAPALALSGCSLFDAGLRPGARLRGVLEAAEGLTFRVQRALMGDALAPEFTEADIRQGMRPNGSTRPDTAAWRALAADGFRDYALAVTGLVEAPLALPLARLMAMPARTQITRHDCVEGWSCIAKWTGVPLAAVLDLARPKPEARYVVFRCHDVIERSLAGPVTYYESIDMADARHPQTILAYGMNGGPLPVANGAPLRLRVERQLGYKMAKYVHTIELVASRAEAGGRGRGSYWADRGYEWYAGI